MPANPKPGSLRIIAGKWRGRRFPVITEPGLRPTPDRIRETLFNWLQQNVVDATCLDLFAGSGALGLEALSRGAAHVTFIDNNREAIWHIQQVLNKFAATNARVLQYNACDLSSPPPTPYQLIFLDPPFGKQLLPTVFDILCTPGWLAPGAFIYIETEADLTHLATPPKWHMLKEKYAGLVCYRLFTAP